LAFLPGFVLAWISLICNLHHSRKMTRLAATIFKIVNAFVVLLYLLACLIPLLPAGKFWIIAFLGLIFPLLFVIVCLFFIGWLLARSRWCIVSLLALAASWQQVSAFAGFNPKRDFVQAKGDTTLRVLTWNVSSWGESSKNKNERMHALPLMLDIVKAQNADVLCFQEFWDTEGRDSRYSNIRELGKMGYPYSYFANTVVANIIHKTGVAIFSRFPISDTMKFTYGSNDFAEHLISADILFNGKKLRLFTTHLQSVRFDGPEYSAISKIKRTDKSGLKDSRTILRKLRNGYRFRETQAQLVRRKLSESPFPVIICGDFNDVPNSYTYFTIRADLQDVFLEKGSGLGRTFQYLFPTLRIDYILAARQFEVQQFNRLNVPYSDHYPVVADLVAR
jgi:endonuclease/exonuclease/phosphatase family metal-dependent hydrolase